MIHVYNPELIIVTSSNMMTFREVKNVFPTVKIVIQNFADEHSVPNSIIEAINAIKIDKPIWVNFNVDTEMGFQKVLIYQVYLSYQLIDEFTVSLTDEIDEHEKDRILKRMAIQELCTHCRYNSGSSILHCAVNPQLIMDENKQCREYKI
jgi:hypothetical protein